MKKWRHWSDSKNFFNARLCAYLYAKTREEELNGGKPCNALDRAIMYWLREWCDIDAVRWYYGV